MTEQEELDAAYDVYQAVREPAWAAYLEAKATAYDVYQAVREPAWAAYKKEVAKIKEKYKND